jgi:hypothetical protein
MSAMVQVACPSCKKTLRVPSQWLGQALRCKHCGSVIQANAQTAADVKVERLNGVATSKNGHEPDAPVNGSRGRASRPTVRPPKSRDAGTAGPGGIDLDFVNLDDDVLVSLAETERPKSGRGIPFLLIGLGVFLFLIVFGVGTAVLVFAPKLKQLAGLSGSSGSAGIGSGSSSVAAEEPVKPPRHHTDLAGPFPNRRALVISANNYLYFNPTLYGTTGGSKPRNVSTLMDRFHSELRIPREQMALISDAAVIAPIKPTKKVIEENIRQFLAGARAQDCLLLMFAGHIVEAAPADGQPDEPCLVPLEGIPNQGESMVPLSAVLRMMEQCPARQKVLILDVCRINPARGLEFPGSGPADSDTPGAMWEKLDQLLAKPPRGVQVWVSCLKDQFSYELELDFNDSVFLHSLDEALAQIVKDEIQYPEEPLPLEGLVKRVNDTTKATLERYTSSKEKRTQVSRLSGSWRDDGVNYDPAQAALPRLQVVAAELRSGAASQEEIKRILADLQVPPVRSAGKIPPVKAEALPFIAAADLKDYVDMADKTPDSFKQAVQKAKDALQKLPVLSEELYSLVPPKTEKQYDDEIQNRQKAIAHRITLLTSLVAALDEEDKQNREAASKRWRANFDYVKSRALAQLAYTYEVTSALGAARRKETPALDKLYNGWRMAAVVKLQGTKEGKDAAKARKKVLNSMEEDYKGTPWEVVARREEFMALGAEWQPAQLK